MGRGWGVCRGKGETFPGRAAFGWWVRGKPMGAWMRKTILFPRKRIASRALQEKSQVKTRCVRVGSTRLYAPMVPLAPHPCVRWWNTKKTPLKLTRLCLHSLKGGSSHQKPSYPVGQMTSPARFSPENHPLRWRGHQRTRSGIPPPQRQWRKRNHGSLKPTPPEPKGIPQSSSPEGYHNSTNPTLGCTVARNHLHWSPFSFSESRTTFSFAVQKKKWFWPPLGKRKNNPPAGQAKTASKYPLPQSLRLPLDLRNHLVPHPLSFYNRANTKRKAASL